MDAYKSLTQTFKTHTHTHTHTHIHIYIYIYSERVREKVFIV